MNTRMPQIREYMTPAPQTVEAEIPLKMGLEILRKYKVRHLPVLKWGNLVGILSDRNVNAALSSGSPERFSVEDVMIPDPYCVPPHQSLVDVAAAMAEEKYGSTIVQDPETGNVAGIFTTTDACRALRELLETLCTE